MAYVVAIMIYSRIVEINLLKILSCEDNLKKPHFKIIIKDTVKLDIIKFSFLI